MKHQKPSTIEALNESIDLLVQENFELKQKVKSMEVDIKVLTQDFEVAYHNGYESGFADATDGNYE